MWSGLTLVSDSDLGAIEPQAITSGSPWGATTWASARAEAKRELKILIESGFGKTVKNPADRLLDLHRPDYVFSYISSVYSDISATAIDHYEDDVNLTTVFASTANRLYIGADYQFDGLSVLMKDALNAQASVLAMKYAGAAGFAAISGATDGTIVSGKTFAQSGRLTWSTIPTDWQRRIVGPTADPLYWVELSVGTAFSAGSTKAAQILTVRAPDGLKRVATLLALYYVLNGLERQAGKPQDWKDKAAYYREQGLSLFQLLKEQGGIPIDTNRNDVIERAEVIDTTPVRLGRA